MAGCSVGMEVIIKAQSVQDQAGLDGYSQHVRSLQGLQNELFLVLGRVLYTRAPQTNSYLINSPESCRKTESVSCRSGWGLRVHISSGLTSWAQCYWAVGLHFERSDLDTGFPAKEHEWGQSRLGPPAAVAPVVPRTTWIVRGA